MECLFSSSTLHLTRSLHTLVRYQVEHSKRYSISTRTDVLSSIYNWSSCIDRKDLGIAIHYLRTNLGSVHIAPEKFENATLFLRLGLPGPH